MTTQRAQMRETVQVPRISVDGAVVKAPLFLASLRVVQRLDAPSQCHVSWQASTLDVREIETNGIVAGGTLGVTIENNTAAAKSMPQKAQRSTTIFSGEITAVEHIHQPSGGLLLRVRAYDPLVRLQRRQTMRTHVDVTTAELTRALTEDLALALSCSDQGPLWPRIIPRFNHDLAMLRHYAARSGLHFTVEDNQLRLFAFSAEQNPPLELTLGKDLFEARLEQNHIRSIAELQVLGWDSHTGELRQGSTFGEKRALSGNEALNHKKAASEQRSLFGAPYESDREAEALARAELERQQAAELTFWGVAEGSVTLRPGHQVQLQGVAAAMVGPHWLTAVTHTVDSAGGYRSELSTTPDPVDAPPALSNIVIGEVCDIDDPEKRGRVQVALPSYAGALSTWMLVMQLGAGTGKGLISLPEVGDQVMVAIPNGDPATGIILGGIYDADGPPHEPKHSTGPAQHHPFSFTTRGGQRLQLNDAEGSVKLLNSSGSYLALTPEGIVLHAAGQLVLESPGKRMRLSAERIDLEQG